MKRLRTYKEPTMREISLPHYLQLLAGSDQASVNVARSDYNGDGVAEDWD